MRFGGLAARAWGASAILRLNRGAREPRSAVDLVVVWALLALRTRRVLDSARSARLQGGPQRGHQRPQLRRTRLERRRDAAAQERAGADRADRADDERIQARREITGAVSALRDRI